MQAPSHNSTLSSLPARWYVIRDVPGRAAWNMAADETLLDLARKEGCGVLRLYQWSTAAISFGRNEVLKGRFDPEELAESGYDLVRRPTGGRALLHVHEITYGAAIPLGAGIGWRSAYDLINAVLCRGLTQLGVPAHIVGYEEGINIPPAAALCFTAPSAGELVTGGAKLVASAVWRDREAFLQQGSIMVAGDQEPLRKLGRLAPEMVGRAATLSECGVACDFDTVSDVLISALARSASTIEMAPTELGRMIPDSRLAHFRDAEWLWRR